MKRREKNVAVHFASAEVDDFDKPPYVYSNHKLFMTKKVATRVAHRLARKYPGIEFGIYRRVKGGWKSEVVWVYEESKL